MPHSRHCNAARAVAGQFEATGSWSVETLRISPEPVEESSKRRHIAEATKTFLDELAETSAFSTHKKKDRLLMARLVRFSEPRGYVMIDQWEPLDVRQFRSTWPVSPQTGVRRMAMLKPFFEYCVANKGMTSNPARAFKNPKSGDEPLGTDVPVCRRRITTDVRGL
jgi:hypothetical protein